MAKYKEYLVKAVEEEIGDIYFKVKVPKEIPQEEVFKAFDKASKYAPYLEGGLSEEEGIKEYDEHFMEAVEKGYEDFNGLGRFSAYLEDFYGWKVEEYYLEEDYWFEW